MKILNINKEDFFLNHFEKNFYFKKNAISTIDITWSDIDEILYGWNVEEGLIHMYKDGKVDPSLYTRDFYDVGMYRKVILKDTFNELMFNGATLVLNRIDIKSTKINKLTKIISHFVKEKTVANGYIAVGGNGTFAKHWDTHDVFAIQLLGKKRWKLFAPTFPFPLKHQTSKEHKHECPTTPEFDEILEAGDVLYIPRGWWHEAIPIESQETFHIAVGVHTAHITDYLSWCIANILSNEENFRHRVRAESVDNLKNISLLTKLVNKDNFKIFQEQILSQDKTVSPFNISKIVNIITGKEKTKTDSVLLPNTSYDLCNLNENHIINGIKISVDKSSKIIFDLMNDCLITKNELVNILSNGDISQKEKISKLIDHLIINDIISEI
ncbi:50S ribosomal protein L16 arginine hydroxylase [compost metagenome]